jgi:hypothetical protein
MAEGEVRNRTLPDAARASAVEMCERTLSRPTSQFHLDLLLDGY